MSPEDERDMARAIAKLEAKLRQKQETQVVFTVLGAGVLLGAACIAIAKM